jgi:hypothetical protein
MNTDETRIKDMLFLSVFHPWLIPSKLRQYLKVSCFEFVSDFEIRNSDLVPACRAV